MPILLKFRWDVGLACCGAGQAGPGWVRRAAGPAVGGAEGAIWPGPSRDLDACGRGGFGVEDGKTGTFGGKIHCHGAL